MVRNAPYLYHCERRNTMKKKLSLFLAIIMILGILPINAFAANNTTSLAQTSNKDYEEATLDGVAYKVYNVADLMDMTSSKKVNVLMTESRKSNSYIKQNTPTQSSNIEFFLDLVWQTYDRPIKNVIMPVYVGNPADSRSKKLGYFEVTTGANEDQYIKMVQTYTDTNPSIEQLVKSAFHVITIAIPKDMRYDFILASTKWDSKKKQDNKVIFRVEGAQSVMHGFGIKWYDTDDANREKIDAVWTGKVGQTLDAKLAKVDRNYSAYFANKIVDSRKENYEDGGEYTPYDYYYNGQKITTYADSENEGKYTDVNLAINGPVDAPTASLTVDGKREGSKVLKNNTKYLYHSVGDYRTFHVLSMREALKVKFNTGKGKLTADGEVSVQIGKDQEIGHSEKITGNESDRTITFPDGSKLVPPEKAQGQKTDNEFKGWNTDSSATEALTKAKLDALTFTEKETIFYAIYGPKADYYVNVEYLDQSNAKIDDKYKLDGQTYPETKSGKTGKAGEEISKDDLDYTKAPKFLGYEITNTVKTEPVPAPGETATYTTDGKYTVKFIYKKLAEIIPEKKDDGKDNPDATKDVKDTYIKVTYQAKEAEGYFGEEAKKAQEVSYYVNPVEGKHVSDVTQPNATANKGYVVDTENKWTYPNGVTTATEITKKTANPLVINANFKKETITKKFTKTWAAADGAKLPDTKPTVTFELYADDAKVETNGERILANGAETAEYKDLVKYNYDNTGKATTEIKYTVKEKGEANNSITLGGKTYAVTYADTGVTNTLGKEVINLTVNKVWAREDGAAKLPETKPTLTFDLYKDGTKVDGQSKTLAAGQTSVKWTGLDKYQANGTDLAVYTVREGQTANNTVELGGKLYEVKMTDMNNGVITVTNTLKKETTDVEFTKVWAAADGTTLPTSLPEVTFVLVKDGTVTTTTAKVDSTTNKAKFSGLDKYTKDGDEIKYTVKEQGEDKGAIKLGGKDYTVTYDKANNKVTNTLVKELKEVKATKTWTAANGDTALTKNPAVKLQLIADGAAVAGKEVAVDANGEANFGKLAKYKADGATEIKYTVKEVGEADGNIKLDGRDYKVTYDGLKVTNELQAKEVKVSYEFVTDKGAKITEEKVNNYLNPDGNWKSTAKEGEDVAAPTTPAKDTKVEIKKGTPEKLIGTYTFKEWKPVTVKAGTEDIKFVGVWEYVGEFYPRGKDITVQVGETPDPKDGIENPGEAPDGTKYKFKEPIDTKTPGDKKAKIVVTIPNPEEPTKPRIEEVEITVHVTDLRCMTPAPEMNPVYDSDEYITGRGIAGAIIEVRYRDYPILRTKVDTFGEWEVYTPYPLEDEQFVYARQIKEPCDPSVWVSEEIRYDYEYWRKDDKKEEPKKPVEIKKVWTPAELNARDHFSYIKGYGNNMFAPNRTITRAEVAMIFARLSINQSVSGAPQFKDVKAGDWYKTAVDIVARQGVVKGYEDGTFRPNQPITRREFAAIAARYAGNIDTWRTFRDVPSTDWAYTLINRVGGAGWITGYEDNTFRPNNLITRAEVVAIVNRMLNRKADKAYVDNNLMKSKHSFIDNLRSAWYFYDVHEAAVGHSFERQPNGVDEKWNRVNGQSFEIRER